MIKINLLKGNNAAAAMAMPMDDGMGGEMSAEQVRKQGALRLFILLLGPIALFVYETQFNIPEIAAQSSKFNKQLSTLQQKNKKFAETVDRIKVLKAQQEKLRKQFDTIDRLRKDRMREVKILDSLQREIPERLWLTKVDLKSGKLSIEGMAESSSEVNQFNEVLTRSAYLKSVKLESDSEETFMQGYVRRFSFIAQMETGQ